MSESNHSYTSNNLAIRVENLSKVYQLYDSPNDRLKEALHPGRKKYHKEFYALRNISFEVERGDSLGIIGQNGSGKSTLLKILSRVLTPTAGRFDVKGRVISLLELGSGFNQELTGIENIYFYGTILGFSKKKVDERLDDILAYADIGQFVYQPLKTYSSGMRARLAFSVASNVDPDILILDEVLAVGDLRFKQKCLRTMHDIIDQNRTVIFVSHDMGAVTNFCSKTIWLKNGRIEASGPSPDIIKKYVGYMTYGMETGIRRGKTPDLASGSDEKKQTDIITKPEPLSLNTIKWVNVDHCESFGEYGGVIEKVALYFRDTNKPVDTLKGGEWLSLYTKVKVSNRIQTPGLGILVKDLHGNSLFTVNNYLHQKPIRTLQAGENAVIRSDMRFPLLRTDKYTLTIALSDGDQLKHTQHHWIHDVLTLTVQNPVPKFNTGAARWVLEDNAYHIEIISQD